MATAGQTISLDAAFMTSDGGPFDDYGIVALQSVPEPSSLMIAIAASAIGLAGACLRKCWCERPHFRHAALTP